MMTKTRSNAAQKLTCSHSGLAADVPPIPISGKLTSLGPLAP